tara:strand:+ start:703 stop:891 length:189 start_codon:yes stop_codon:yes gene_type:complete
MEFDNIKYLYGCLENEKSKLDHLLQAADSVNYDRNNPIIKRQKKVVTDLVQKIKDLESKNES